MPSKSLACALVLVGTSMLAAPEQTAQPGQMTQPNVFVQNRGRAEAVPVFLREAPLDTPLRVRVVNMQDPRVNDEAIHARLVPQSWDYQSIFLKDGQDPAAALLAPGVAGWETTGIALVKPDGVTLLLKRPHLP